jgi:hypothetical protein
MSGPQTFAHAFPQHRISNTDNLRSGSAVAPGRQALGVPLGGSEAQAVIVLNLGAPAAGAANSIALSQAVGVGASFILNGALVVAAPAGFNLAGQTVAVFDVPRNVIGAWTTASVLTITGRDEYGQTMSEATASGTAHTGKKAFKIITGVTSSASITAATLGTGTVLGLPYKPVVGGFVGGLLNENTADAGAYAVPERVASTTTTNDVRGTYAPAGALNGTNVYTCKVAVQNGPNDSDAYGIAQA